MARTDKLTNTSHNEKPNTNTKEGKKPKRRKKLLKARNDIESTNESNRSPNTPQGINLWSNTPQKITTPTTSKMRKTEKLEPTTIAKKKTHEKFRELISVVKDTNTNNRDDTTHTTNDNNIQHHTCHGV